MDGTVHDDPKNPRSMHRVRILDPEGVRSVLRAFRKRYASDAKAAAALGIQPWTLSKLLSGHVSDAMSFDTYAGVLNALGGEVRVFSGEPQPHAFSPYLNSLEAEKAKGPLERRYAEFESTLNARLERASRVLREAGSEVPETPQGVLDAAARVEYDLLQRFRHSVVTEDHESAWRTYEEWLKREVTRLKPSVGPILVELWAERSYNRRFADFMEAVDRPRDRLPAEADLRCWLALLRAVEPLADSTDTWGIERTWQELHDAGELKGYLKAALKREQVLMRPLRYLDKVHRGRPPRSHREAMESSAGERVSSDGHHSAAMTKELIDPLGTVERESEEE